MQTIYKIIKHMEHEVWYKYPNAVKKLPEDIVFITSQELEDLYPDETPKERENLITKKHGCVFLMQIGDKLASGQPHDGRAPDYDDWQLNGDILFWFENLKCALEISSMGIRVDKDAMLAQARRGPPLPGAARYQVLDGEHPDGLPGGYDLICSSLAVQWFSDLNAGLGRLAGLLAPGGCLAVATLAAQFFVDWAFLRIPFFTNYSSSGNVSVPPLTAFGLPVQSALEKYLFVLILVVIFSLLAKNLVRGAIGRQWMAIRDMDVAASVIGIRPMYAKLTAFAVSSFIVGVAGALWGYIHLGSWEPLAFDLGRSFQLLFMVIIGGLGSIIGSFFGAAFIVLVPVALTNVPHMLGLSLSVDTAAHVEHMVFGALIVFFLIAEPHGLARLWSIGKEKLRIWPFPH